MAVTWPEPLMDAWNSAPQPPDAVTFGGVRYPVPGFVSRTDRTEPRPMSYAPSPSSNGPLSAPYTHRKSPFERRACVPPVTACGCFSYHHAFDSME